MPVPKRISGVYLIKCFGNNKVYVGVSKSILGRWRNHKYHLRKNQHPNEHLQSSWNKYGEISFCFGIIEYAHPVLFEEKENYWINYFDCINRNKGFNRLLSGKQPTPKETNNSNKLGNSKAKIKPVVVINKKDGEVSHFSSITKVSDDLELSYKRLIELCSYWNPESTSKHDRKSYKGFIIVPEEMYDPSFDYLGFSKTSTPYKFKTKKPKIKRNYKKNPEDIVPYADRDLGRKPIKLVSENETLSFTSHKEAITTLQLTPSKVNKCLKHPGKYKHRGYFFYPIELTKAA